MAGFGFSPADIVTAVKLSWKLYHDCLLVAYEAPDAFRQLVNELQSLQATLRMLRDNADTLGPQRKEAVQGGVENCVRTLKALEKLMARFDKLATSNRLQFWRRIQWSIYQGSIEEFRARIMAHTCTLSLTISTIGSATLLDIQGRLERALARPLDAFEFPPSGSLTPHPIDTDPPSSLPISPPESMIRGSIDSDTTLVGPLAASTISPDNSSHSSKSPLFDSTLQPTDVTIESEEEAEASSNSSTDILKVVADAELALSTCSNDQTSRRPRSPPVVEPPYPDYVVDVATAKRFQICASSQRNWNSVTVEEWLQNAAWWLLKSRTLYSVYQRDSRCESPHSSLCGSSIRPNHFSDQEPREISLLLALEDLKKVSWIVYNVVLKDESRASSLTYTNLKLFHDLTHAIHCDFPKLRRGEAQLEDRRRTPQLTTTIWERPYVFDMKIKDGLIPKQQCGDHARWITVEDADAGLEAEGEHVLFRTFVNAAIGSAECRNRSMGAPYLLVLWGKDGESECKASICNQTGVVHLSRNLTGRDLLGVDITRLPAISNIPTLQLMFPGQTAAENIPVAIEFLNKEDFEEFTRNPRQLLELTKDREERSDKEELLEPPVVVKTLSKVSFENTRVAEFTYNFCELRILETVEGGWKRSRRLVITTSPMQEPPKCKSFFLPVDHVYVKSDLGSLSMLLKFSDCNQRDSVKLPDYSRRWSRVYNRTQPNLCFSLIFRSSEDLQEFRDKLLNYSGSAKWQSDVEQNQRLAVFKATDMESAEQLRAIHMVSPSVDDGVSSSIFYVPKTVDFVLEPTESSARGEFRLSVHFPAHSTFITDYVSNHSMKFHDLKETETAQFDHCVKKTLPQKITFRDLDVAQQLFQNLTSRWLFRCCGKVARVKYEETGSQNWFSKKGKGPKSTANVSMWDRDLKEKQLLVRWDDEAGAPWLSAALTFPTAGHGQMLQKPGSEKVTLHAKELLRGSCIHLGTMKAVDSKGVGKGQSEKEGYVTLQFDTCREKENFAEKAGLECP